MCGLESRIPEEVEQIYRHIIGHFHKFSHRYEGGRVPRLKECFNQMWPEFENLLTHLVESGSDFHDRPNRCPFADLHDSLAQLETELSGSSATEQLIPDIKLLPHQSEINQNLERIAPLLAAFYRDWVRMQQSTNFKCRSYLLAHLAREVDSGLRGALSTKREQKKIKRELAKENLGDLKESIGHISSIMAALGIRHYNELTVNFS